MPVYAHGLCGVGLGAASVHAARSGVGRRIWIGAAAFLAYLPDIAEWSAQATGVCGWPPSAMASLPVALVSCGVVLLILRALGETSRVIGAAAAIAILSHTLLDWADGGIPLWWPFSSRVTGPDCFGLHPISDGGRLRRELLLFGWLAAVGLAVGIHRELYPRAGQPRIGQGGGWKMPVWQSLGMWPLAALAVLHGYVADQTNQAEQLRRNGQFAEAIPHYERSLRLSPVDNASAGNMYWLADCYRRVGDEDHACHWFQEVIRRFPDYTLPYVGLAEFYLTARDPRYRRPEKVPLLVAQIRRTARHDDELRAADRFMQQVERTQATRPGAAGARAAG